MKGHPALKFAGDRILPFSSRGDHRHALCLTNRKHLDWELNGNGWRKKNANEKKSLSVAATAVFGFCCLTQKQILSRERNKKAKEKVKNGDFFSGNLYFVTEPRYGAD